MGGIWANKLLYLCKEVFLVILLNFKTVRDFTDHIRSYSKL